MTMMTRLRILFVLMILAKPAAAWAPPRADAIPEADGYVAIPGAAVMPDKAQTLRAIFEATRAPEKPTELAPAINNLGSELNLLAAVGVPEANRKFAVVFHGPALAAILDEAHYRARFGVSNPNLKVLAELRKRGVELFVCGQNLASDKIDPKTLSPDVQVASDALIVLMTYQNRGYAVLSF
jgi:intracellular sulfur oxidation DsrE/DsrF family protein